MRIGFGDLEDLVRAVHGDGSGRSALLGRFKYFQRMSFPGGSNTGRGSRANYGLEQILAFLVAFEILELGIPPVRAVRLIRTSWPQIARALALTWKRQRGGSEEPVLLALAPGALAELGASEDSNAPAPDLIVVTSQGELATWLQADHELGPPSLYLLDPRRVILPITRELIALQVVDADEVASAFDSLGCELFGSSSSSAWKVKLSPLLRKS